MNQPLGIVPFVPSGASFERSRELFLALGFEQLWSGGGYAGFRHGAAKFILQEFDNRAFAEQLMLKLEVPDLDAWWAVIEPKRLPENFPGVRVKPPIDYPWGREIHFIDLAGVCWHIATP